MSDDQQIEEALKKCEEKFSKAFRKKVDQRADIWAFGVVLYEMLTGKELFRGEDATDTLASVVKEQPNLDALPAPIRRVVAACLEKDPRNRLQAIRDWKFLVDNNRGTTGAVESPARHAAKLPWLVSMAAVVVAAALAFIHFREAAPNERAFHLAVPLPNAKRPGYVELSPDGRRLAVALFDERGTQIYLRSRDSDQLQPLAGTNTAREPFWSPDSRFIGFFADGKLRITPAAGGPAQDLCGGTGLGRGGTWNRNGVILFANEAGSLHRVNATGGDCVAVETEHGPGAFPTFLPDGNNYVFVSFARSNPGVYLASMNSEGARKIIADVSSIVYVPAALKGRNAHLLFLRDQSLMAQAFDAINLRTIGDPFNLITGVANSATSPQVAASVSADGTLAYMSGPSINSQVTWVDRAGTRLGTVGPEGLNIGFSVSPDSKAVAITRQGSNSGVWLYDLERASESRLIPFGSYSPSATLWSPDSRRILVSMTGPAGPGLYGKNLTSGELESLDKSPAWSERRLSDWSRDGKFLIFTEVNPTTQADIWYVQMNSGRPSGEPVEFLATDAVESMAQLSPDGKWLAYTSSESGTSQVYIRPFPTGSGVWKVSVDVGREPRWRADGRVLYFNGRISLLQAAFMASAVNPDGRGGLQIGTPQRVFEAAVATRVPQANLFTITPDPDGQRFLVNMLTDTTNPLVNVVTNVHNLIANREAENRRTN